MNTQAHLHALARLHFSVRRTRNSTDRLSLIRQKRRLEQQVELIRQMIEENPEIYNYYRSYLIALLNNINDIRIALEILYG